MQNDVEPRLAMHELAIGFDVIALSWLRTKVGANAAIDCDSAGGDQFIAVAPRAETSCGEKAVEAHRRRLRVWLGLRKADDFRAFLELAALFQELDALETLQDVSFGGDGAGSF